MLIHFMALTKVPKVCHCLSHKFIKLPLNPCMVDLIAIPDFAAGAMENWGLITYRLTSLLYDEHKSSIANKEWVAVVVAHELAHQVCFSGSNFNHLHSFL